MPNIIQQQDELKNLPDASIAKLMQFPIQGFPPFLVAAEAQRRQQMRSQYAPQAPKTSVVDQLTQKLTGKLPEDIKPTPQVPPNIPAPQVPQAGIAGLPQAQPAPQAMAAGGQVRRFASGSYVSANAAKATGGIPVDQWGVPLDPSEFGDPQDDPSIADRVNMPVVPASPISEPASQIDASQSPSITPAPLDPITAQYQLYEQLMGRGLPPAQAKAVAQSAMTDRDRQATGGPDAPTGAPSPSGNREGDPPQPPSIESQIKAAYAPKDASSWEKAMPWFNAAAQFLDPTKTTWQSVGAAAQGFGQGEAQIAANQREQQVAQQRAVLDYHLQMAQNQAAFALKAMETQAKAGDTASNYYLQQANHLQDEKTKLQTNPMLMAQPGTDTAIKTLDAQMNQVLQQWRYMMGQNDRLKTAGTFTPTGQ